MLESILSNIPIHTIFSTNLKWQDQQCVGKGFGYLENKDPLVAVGVA